MNSFNLTTYNPAFPQTKNNQIGIPINTGLVYVQAPKYIANASAIGPLINIAK
jgi:hypothetical protein